MSISLSIFLLFYFILIALAFFLALVNLYHIFRFGHYDAQSYFITGLFVAGLILIGFVSFVVLAQIDWSHSITLFSNGPTTGPSSIPGSQF